MRRIACLLCLLVLAAGCGGGERHTSTARSLPGRLARSWAREADLVAQAVDAGDTCRANGLAQELRDEVIARRTNVPPRYRTVLLKTVNRLVSKTTCPPRTVTDVVTTAPLPPAGQHPPGHGPPGHGPPGHHKHGHGGHGHGGDGG